MMQYWVRLLVTICEKAQFAPFDENKICFRDNLDSVLTYRSYARECPSACQCMGSIKSDPSLVVGGLTVEPFFIVGVNERRM